MNQNQQEQAFKEALSTSQEVAAGEVVNKRAITGDSDRAGDTADKQALVDEETEGNQDMSSSAVIEAKEDSDISGQKNQENISQEAEAQNSEAPVQQVLIPACSTKPNNSAYPLALPVQQGVWQQPAYIAKTKEPFEPQKADIVFASACIVLGFLFIRWVFIFGMWQGWGVTAFTFLFAGSVLAYAKAKSVRPAKNSWFWLVILLLTGLSYALWPAGELTFYQSIFLFGCAVYWCGSAFGSLILEKTSSYLPLDALNLLFVIPFKNFALLFKSAASLFSKSKADKKKQGKTILAVVLGVLLGLLLLVMILPMLLEADEGFFKDLMNGFVTFFNNLITESLAEVLIQLVLGIPVALYITGLVIGQAHKRYTGKYKAEEIAPAMQSKRVLPVVTISIALGAISLIYILFIFSQIPYYFSAFAGIKPAQFVVYSEYARQGFFELCRVAAINLVLLILANALAVKKREDSAVLKIINILLASLTLLIIVTAFSKMYLYIQVQGFTQKRIMTCVFMVFLAIVCTAVIVLQWKKFSIVRMAAVIGSVMLCILCLSNLDGIVVSYNAYQYQKGNLSSFDTVILSRSGASGTWAALDVTPKESHEKIKIMEEIRYFKQEAEDVKWTSRDCLIYTLLRNTDVSDKK